MTKLALHWQILIAIVLAVMVGMLFNNPEHALHNELMSFLNFVGDLFLNALKMLVIPLVFSSIICGVASIGRGENIGRLGIKTLLFYLITSLLAILIGLLLVNLFQPGLIDGKPAGQELHFHTDSDALTQKLDTITQSSQSMTGLFDIFLRMVPPNIISAAADGQMLGLIVFAMLFGFFITRIKEEQHDTQIGFWQGIFEVMMHMTMFIMKFAPIGVFALVAKTILSTGLDIFGPLLWFFLCVFLALIIHTFGTMALVLKFTAKVNPIKHYRIMNPVMLMAFSTASSSATLPLTIEAVEKDAGVSNKVTSFVLPLGATVNMNGTALYECVAAMFIAQAYGLDLSFLQQFTIVITALLTSVGVAGVPAASLVAISVILTVIGLPLDGIGLLLVTDRLLDMMRTAVNIFGDSVCAVYIARSEGEKTKLV
jgi:Na+/H+-dicarboxylate symporter